MNNLKKKITIIDYGVGNILSIKNAINFLGHEAKFSSKKNEIIDSTHIILPGVGAFPSAMKKMEEVNLVETLKKISENNIFVLGICLGMQMLFQHRKKKKKTDGLKILNGEVKLLPVNVNNKKFKLPHIGWGNLIIDKNVKNPILKNLTKEDRFYFMHSFFVYNIHNSVNLVDSSYGNLIFPAVVQKENIFGCQFHPEKSANSGLKVLENFINL